MTMLGSFPATDISTFQMFQDQSVQGHGGQRSVSPWTTQQTVEYCQSYQLPADTSSRIPSDQFTPHEYPTVTKLPPRQLQWVTSSQNHGGCDVTALSYDVHMMQSQGHCQGQLQQVAVTTPNTGWTSTHFNQPVTQNLVSTASGDCSASNHLIQIFQNTTKNYFLDCPTPVEQSRAVMVRSVSGQGQFTADNYSSAVTSYTTGQPRVTVSTSYSAPPTNLHSIGVKSDPDGPSD